MSAAKSCNCINELREKLKSDSGDNQAWLDTATMFNFKSGVEIQKPYPLYGYYRRKKADGSFMLKATKCFFVFEYCPFCGKKYVAPHPHHRKRRVAA